jgi:chaperonin GroES
MAKGPQPGIISEVEQPKETLEAYGRRIIVRPEQPPQRSSGGLHLPAQAQEAPRRGEIISVGGGVNGEWKPGGEYDLLKLGETVVFAKYAGVALEVDGEELLVLTVGDVLGRIVTA